MSDQRPKEPTVERKVLRVFGRVIKPANWVIFCAGIVLIIAAPILWQLLDLGFEAALLWVQGIQLSVEGYGEIKDDQVPPNTENK